MNAAAAFIAWLGAALFVLSEGRRALALGMALITVGFAVLAQTGGGPLAASAFLVGGGIAAGRRFRSGPDVWGVMPAGSTARVVLAAAIGLLALWISTSVTTGPGASVRFAALSVLGLMAARVLTASEPPAVLGALAALALAVAVAAGVAGTSPGPAVYIFSAIVAGGISLIRVREIDGT
ncbi:MAG TPA: hypothetical protein VGJ79_12590 [Candidatus Dormibacteraeota bacterium]